MKIEDRFWKKVNKTGGCWIWTGCKSNKGYGQISKPGSTAIYAHRLSWEIHFGEIIDNLYVLHRCDNRSCVNPSHLFLGTPQDNTDDMLSKGRWRPPAPKLGESNNKHKLTTDQVKEIRSLYKTGLTTYEIAESFPVTPSAIQRVVNGETWRHVT